MKSSLQCTALGLLLLFCSVHIVRAAAVDETPARPASPNLFLATSLIPDGTYAIGNHPDGAAAPPLYCIRLDQLFGGYSTITFSCDPSLGVGLQMTVTTVGGLSELHISGTVYGGRDSGSAYDPNNAGVWDVDFVFNNAVPASGDDDVVVPYGNGSGTIIPQFSTSHFSAGSVFYLSDYDGAYPYSFRVGDEDDDNGHRGYPGISGWGWIGSGTSPDRSTHDRTDTKDWFFTLEPICIDDPATFPSWDGEITSLGGGLGSIVVNAPNGLKIVELGASSVNTALMEVQDMDGNTLNFVGSDPITGSLQSGYGVLTYAGAAGDAPEAVKLIIGSPGAGTSRFFLEISDCCDRTLRVDPVLNLTATANETDETPLSYSLSQSYPNPFNPSTTITFTLPETADVNLVVLDVLGRVVKTLADGALNSGSYSVSWDGRDASGTLVPSGVYLYRLEAGSFQMTRSMTLLK